jgi:acyl carrier protein
LISSRQVHDTISRLFPASAGLTAENCKMNIVKGWDSLGHMQLILEVENIYKVRFTAEEIVGATTLEDLVRTLNEKLPN